MTTSPNDASAEHFTGRGFGYLVVRLGEMVMERGEMTLAPLNLKPREYNAMVCILNGEGMSQQDLSRKLGLYAPRMVALIDGLQERGLVERTVSPSDRRRHVLTLTASGRKLLTRATRMAARMDAELFGHISEEERARFEVLVQRIAADPRMSPTD